MDDNVIRIAVGLRLGLAFCHPHACSDSGAEVNVDGIHGLSCRYSRVHHCHHSALNDIEGGMMTMWSHLVCTDQIESTPMELQWFLGRGGNF